MATAPILGARPAFIPNSKAPPSEHTNPEMIPAHAPAFVVPFQKRPYKNGAKNEPDIVPHENDMRVSMAFGVIATTNEKITKTAQKTLKSIISVFLLMF